MRLKNATGTCSPLLASAVALLLGGCETPLVDTPDAFKTNPKVVAIYATDFAYSGALSDVLVYSATEPTRTSKPPASYGGYRIEFNQPLYTGEPGGTAVLASNSDKSGTLPSGTAFSYCSPVAGGAPVTLVDVDDAAIGTIASSLCYQPASALGSNPNLTLIPGLGAPYDNTAMPFTCNAFSYEDGSTSAGIATDGSGNILKAGHKYALKFDSAKIKGSFSRLPLTAPTDTGWSSGQFTFTTDTFSLMAVGYQSQSNFFYTWLEKPAKGYMKDLAPIANKADYVQPPDDTAIALVFSAAIGDPTQITLTRADDTSDDGAAFDPGADPISGVAASQAPRYVAVAPGWYWESGGTYKLTIPKELAAADGTLLGTDYVYTIKTGQKAAAVTIVSPVDDAVAQAIGLGKISLYVSEPVDATTLAGVDVKDSGGAVVPGAATLPDGYNLNKIVYTFTPASLLLKPSTTYTIEAKGLKVAPATPNAGKTIADFTSTFTTANFRSTGIYRHVTSPAVYDVPLDRAADTVTVSGLATFSLSPVLLRDGSFLVKFTNAPTAGTVTNTSVVLSEVATNAAGLPVVTPIDPAKYTVTAGTSATAFVIKITDATYSLKYKQKYSVKLLTSITDAATGNALKAEGCTGSDCSITHAFTTRIFKPSMSIVSPTTGEFKVAFTAAVDPTSLNDYLTTAYKLYKVNADGGLAPNPIAMNCTAFAASGTPSTTTDCTTTTVLAPNTSYLASAKFLKTAVAGDSGPALVAQTVSSLPTDASGTYFGSITASFRTPCP